MAELETSPSALVITLFGPMQALVHGCPFARMRSRKGMWLLALLALRQNRPIAREWLTGTLWPDTDQSQAFANLRPILSELRNGLGDQSGRLQSPDRRTVFLDLAGADVDVLAFDAAIDGGSLRELERAAALYRGPLLEGCAEEWVFQERAVRERQCLQALGALGDAALAASDYARAASFYQRAAGIDPWWDAAQRGWMEALARNGDRNAALRVYREFSAVLREDPNAAPDDQTTALYLRLRAETRRQSRTTPQAAAAPPPRAAEAAPKPEPPRAGSLPHALTALIGREDECAAVASCLRRSRLVTLTGIGGIGKTRLAAAVAAETAPEYAGGAWSVTLDALSDGSRVIARIAEALEVKEETGHPLLQSVTDRLRGERLLLVLDNCEHLLTDCARAADHLLRECAGVRILATSREALGIMGETAWAVPSLAAPEPSQLPDGHATLIRVLAGYESAQLFVERAQSVQKTFSLTPDNALAVAEICARLGGLPLAIELAAARLRALTPAQIAERLDDHLSLLTGGNRTAPSRQQTLRAMLDWSYSLLSEPERTLLARLSVFSGEWTLEAVEAVCAGEGIEACETLDLLGSLADKSLVIFEERASGGRYRLLEMVRQYAAEHLETEAVKERHRDWLASLAEAPDDALETASEEG